MLGHLLLALAIMGVVAAATKRWLAGAFAASTWAIARELTQAEYRWIEAYGGGLRANMPWWGGFDLLVWQKLDPWLDWVVPSTAAFLLALILERKPWREG